jgi:hypothetical protein
MSLRIVRDLRSTDGTFGQLWNTRSGGFFNALHTCEDDWLDNRRNVSCIPAGTYKVLRTIYYKHGYETFEIIVPGRSRILFHPGNTEEDTDGCVLVGMRRGTLWVRDEDAPLKPLAHKTAVVNSQQAFRLFMESMRDIDEDILAVDWAPGLP